MSKIFASSIKVKQIVTKSCAKEYCTTLLPIECNEISIGPNKNEANTPKKYSLFDKLKNGLAIIKKALNGEMKTLLFKNFF